MAKKNSITDGDTTLNFRIPKELKMTIVAQADNKNISTSKYLRNLLETVFNGSYCQEIEAKSERQVFLFSQEFLQLIVWIYKKRENNQCEVDKSYLERYVKTLKRTDKYLPQTLVIEFDKVLKNLLSIRDKTGYDESHFDFHKFFYDSKNFNFKKVEKFLLDEDILEDFFENGESFNQDLMV